MRPPTSAAVPPVPIQEAVGEFFGSLLDLGTAASKVTPQTIEASGEHVIAVYRDDVGKAAALVIADLVMAAASGAALAMIPAAAVKEVRGRGKMTDTLMENFREVANITTSILNTPNTPHLTLLDVWASDDPELPEAVWDLLATHSKRREFVVTMDGYGEGNLGFVIG